MSSICQADDTRACQLPLFLHWQQAASAGISLQCHLLSHSVLQEGNLLLLCCSTEPRTEQSQKRNQLLQYHPHQTFSFQQSVKFLKKLCLKMPEVQSRTKALVRFQHGLVHENERLYIKGYTQNVFRHLAFCYNVFYWFIF